jgi:thiamine-monophosphate kinase
MRELELIRWIRSRGLPGARRGLVRAGPGDDCAVLSPQPRGWELLLKTDGVVAGVHFDRRARPGAVGYKALARALSDIAAMGGEPVAAVVFAALARAHRGAWARSFQKGLARAAKRFGCPVVGGDVSGTPGPTTVAVALLGRARRGKALLRNSARAGDRILVTGTLGASISGKHLDFVPRMAEGRFLAGFPGIGACVDVSDGLARDLAHILEESGGLGADLEARAIPVSAAAKRLRGDTLSHALSDGEDYEILFTVRPGRAAALAKRWPFRTRLTAIGKVTARGAGLRLRGEDGRLRRLAPSGWEHLA